MKLKIKMFNVVVWGEVLKAEKDGKDLTDKSQALKFSMMKMVIYILFLKNPLPIRVHSTSYYNETPN